MNESVESVNTISLNSLKLYEFSLLSSSNVISNNLLNGVWSSNRETQDGQVDNQIIDLTQNIAPQTAGHKKNWKTILSKINAKALLEKSLPTCPNNCNERFHSNESKKDLNTMKIDIKKSSGNANEKKRFKSLFEKVACEEEMTSSNRQSLKHKLGKSRTANECSGSIAPDKNISELDWDKEEEAEKAHKSNVAKITFKTAKEQLLASNPAARRVLGTSRKAQSKFISPMIGTNVDKQENMEPKISDERLKHIDAKMIELIESEIIDKGTPIGWDEIAGLQMAKSVIQESVVWPLLRPDIFTGLRRPPKGILLFGPPGTGKTLIGKCIAAQCHATFFSISASSLTSKWIGDGEKMVRALFAVAAQHQPAVIFIDEIDSLLTQRSDTEHEATRRIKTEFLVQFDGAATREEDKLLVVGATNRPQELDEAARRRLVKRLYIPLPDDEARWQMVRHLLKAEAHALGEADMREVARLTAGHSGADMRALCAEAAMGPVRDLPASQLATIHTDKVRPVCLQDFTNALQRVRPSVSQDDLGQYVKWNNTYGQGF